jgi:hypothetical protein
LTKEARGGSPMSRVSRVSRVSRERNFSVSGKMD